MIGGPTSDDSQLGFYAQSDNGLAQSVRHPLFLDVAETLCTQRLHRLRTTEGYRESAELRDAGVSRQRVERACNICRHSRSSTFQQQLADTGKKPLELPIWRAPPFGKPDRNVAQSQYPGGRFERCAGVPRIDGEQVHGSRKQPREWVRE